ncbi:MAG TPA: MMPL family transporter [Solirubrobacteraceae bacterium]|nr:MMPL family transporter [Solirubrobacteraceae bacterium]
MIARLADLAVAHSRRTLLIAGAVFLLAAALGGPVVSILKSQSSDFQDPKAPNQQVLRAIERATGQTATYGLVALVPSAGDVRTDRAAQRESARVAALLAVQPGFQRAIAYGGTGPNSHLSLLVSRDGHQALVLGAFANREDSTHAVQRVRAQVAGSGVRFGGNDVAFDEINKTTSSDLERAEMFALPILLLLSFWVFRGLIAAALPLLVGGFAIVLTFFLLRLIDQFAGLSIFAVNLVTGVGLGLGIDYSLFVLSRYREELAGGADVRAAILRTMQTAGRTVLYGSLTVAGALASMLVFPLRFLYSMGVGGALVALCAGAVSLIVLPAVLVALGPRIDALAPARLQRSAARSARSTQEGAWYRLARGVMRRPGLVALSTAALLLAVASPALRLSFTPADAHVLPASSQARQVAEALTHDFGVDPSQTITMVVRAPAGSPAKPLAGRTSVAAIAARAKQVAGAQASEGPPRYAGGGVWEIELQPAGTDGAPANQALVKNLRAIGAGGISPALLVGGSTAWFVDQKAAIAAHLPLALAILAVMTLGFLFLMTGSAILPFIALAMNLLTVAVGAGLLVLIFQDGNLGGLFGFTPIGGLEESNLVLLFVIAFALSTDYGVFLFGRIKEAHDDGLATRDAVAYGLERTGRLVTAAALLFCVAIGAFSTSHIFFVKQLGVGAALAVAIDATVVRALLVPALMGRLGELTWWAPRPLRRFHKRFGLRERTLGEPGRA